MKIGILGTGQVGATVASHLLSKNHRVMMGARSATNEAAANWSARGGSQASHGTFDDAAAFGELIFNCTSGMYSLDAIRSIDPKHLEGKIIIDLANALDFSTGELPTITVGPNTSLGEEIQKLVPAAQVVKAFSLIAFDVMCNPGAMNKGKIDFFICGDDEHAKSLVKAMVIAEFGWRPESIRDLGGMVHARSVEQGILLFASVAMQSGSWTTAIKFYSAS